MKRNRPQATRNPLGLPLRWRRSHRADTGAAQSGPQLSRLGSGRGALALGLSALMVTFISLLMVNFINQVVQSASLDEHKAILAAEVTELALANQQLAAAVAYSQSPAYVERIAREQLGYGREGDLVIRPYPAPTSQSAVGADSTDDTTLRSARSVENWRLWWWAFFPPESPSQE